MHSLLDLLHRIRDVRAIIAWGGYVRLTAIIFAETGLLIGFFLPGDSLLVTAGLLAPNGRAQRVDARPAARRSRRSSETPAAISSATARGARLFTREDSRFFNVRTCARARVLRKARWKDDHHGAVHADRAHICACRRRRGGHALLDIHLIQHRRRARLDLVDAAARLFSRTTVSADWQSHRRTGCDRSPLVYLAADRQWLRSRRTQAE